MDLSYDVIVVGAGHAGCEAAEAAANMGVRVLLITMDMTKMAQMSCNPAMGGIAKGQIIKEIDALGGYSGIATDLSMIQFRMLNRSKGPAVWSPRAQCDRMLFSKVWRDKIEGNKNIDIWQDRVNSLVIEKDQVTGVGTVIGVMFKASTVILTTGTFEEGLIHVGSRTMIGGRISEPSSNGISKQLLDYGIENGRMKTGTPARLDGRTIQFEKLEEQKGDKEIRRFSFQNTPLPERQKSCYITYTSEEVHHILREGFKESPLFNGTIKGVGPRYCPSIEDKVVTFAERNKHQLFLEPEGWDTNEYYINGFSSSLPWNVQYKALRKIRGLENVKIYRPGYAIEYDYYPPVQLKPSLESKKIKCLYFAGQVNGTTGYEEAAAQGLMAGINAARKIKGEEAIVLKRDQAYIGVLIDDLVTKGVDEPYRMFTSRAEYRILLRQDNADRRLTPISKELGLASDQRMEMFEIKENKRKELSHFINSYSVSPEQINAFLEEKNSAAIKQKVKLRDVLLRPEISIQDMTQELIELRHAVGENLEDEKELLEALEIEIKYKGYIEREKTLADKISRLNNIHLERNLDYSQFESITTEARQKLNKVKPETIGQAMRIPGVSPNDIHILLLYMGR